MSDYTAVVDVDDLPANADPVRWADGACAASIPQRGSERVVRVIPDMNDSSDKTHDSSDDELEMMKRDFALTSTDDPDWLSKSRGLADLLWKRFQKINRHDLLVECIDVERQISIACAGDDLDGANAATNLAHSLWTRYYQTGEDSLVVKSINLLREALSILPNGHPRRCSICNNLATSLRTHYQLTGEKSLLAEAVDLGREVLSLQPRGHPERFMSCNNLANSLLTRYNQTSEESLLAESVDFSREALLLCPRGHPDRSMLCNNLAFSLWTRFEQTRYESLLTDAIDLNREALSLQPSNRFSVCNNLALALRARFELTGEESLFAEAMNLQKEALSLLSSKHPDRARSLINLAISLKTYSKKTGKESLLMEAIQFEKEALSLRPPGHPLRSIPCQNLAVSLRMHSEQTGDESLLTEAIDLLREALSLQPHGHVPRSTTCHTLATSLWERYTRTGDESLLAEAIDLHKESLSLRPRGHPGRSISCGNLAISLLAYFDQTGQKTFLTEAIELQREALSLQAREHPERFSSCNNLAVSLWKCFNQTGVEPVLAEAINLYREALYLLPREYPSISTVRNNLAAAIQTRFELTGDEALLAEAIDLNKEAIEALPPHHASRWMPIVNLIRIYLDRRFSEHNVVHAINYMQQALSLPSDDWRGLLSRVAHFTDLIDLTIVPQESLCLLLTCFSTAIDLASRVAGFLLDPESQLRYLSDSRQLGPRAYWCAIACGKAHLGLELIERTRAMMWTQALHMRNPQLEGAPPDLASELQVLFTRMSTSRIVKDSRILSSETSLRSGGLSSIEKDMGHKSSSRIHLLIEKIRKMPGREAFMRGLSFKGLAQCASHNAVVILIASEEKSHAVILRDRKQAPLTLELSGITLNELTTMSVMSYAAHMRGSGSLDDNHNHRMRMKVSPSASSDLVFGKLWITVVKPVIDCLQIQKASALSRPRLHWCPTGVFMFLPLHAAGTYNVSHPECCADYVVSSYTPTLSALLRAQKSNPSFSKVDMNLSVIAATKAQDVALPILWNVKAEIGCIQGVTEGAGATIANKCVDDEAVITKVAEVFKSSNTVHIACHGIQNLNNALSSGFCLSDGNLTISQLMDLDLKDAFFAFLSACETAKGDEKQPDQTVHLAAAMLFVGFRSVVATMWAMNDADGPRLAKLFYERLFSEDIITLDAIPYALDYAVGELRNSGVPPERWATFIHLGA